MRLWKDAFSFYKENMPNQKNKDILEEIKEKTAKAKSITFVDFLGLKVNDINNFRQQLLEKDAEPVIAKNTLFKLALKENGLSSAEIEQQLKGPTAAIFSYKDPVEYLKILYAFIKKLELPKVKFALIGKDFTNAEKIAIISSLPAKDQLLAQVVGGLKSPLVGLVNVFGGTQRKLVTVLSKIAENKK